MKTEEKLNMTMLCDFYELTMGNGYFQTGFKDRITYFDVYFRSVPDGGGFAIAAGLEQLIEYIEDLHFDEQDIAYLRGKGIFCEEFLEYLRTFRFTGDIYAVPEGTPVFPKEPMVIVRAPAIEAQLVETFALLTVNHQSLIATKASRICRAAQGRIVSKPRIFDFDSFINRKKQFIVDFCDKVVFEQVKALGYSAAKITYVHVQKRCGLCDDRTQCF